MATLQLYTTEHCHLCEMALQLVLASPALAGHELELIDIAVESELIARYGHRIPVLRGGRRELDWPFGAAEIDTLSRELEEAPGRS